MGYKSHAQRKAVHASKADGGKGNPNKKSPARLEKIKINSKSSKYIDIDKGVAKNKLKTSKENRQQKGLTATNKQALSNFNEQKLKTSPALAKLSASCKAAARRKFKVYPSAYANMWASKTQKKGKC